MTFQDTTADVAEEFEDGWTIVLNADGTGQTTSGDDTSNFTWEPTSDGFKTRGDMKATFTDEGDGIKTSIFGVEVVFVRAD